MQGFTLPRHPRDIAQEKEKQNNPLHSNNQNHNPQQHIKKYKLKPPPQLKNNHNNLIIRQPSPYNMNNKNNSISIMSSSAPLLSEQQMSFESKLCNDPYGIAICKIDRHGKAQLRHLRCIPYDHVMDANHHPRRWGSRSANSAGKQRKWLQKDEVVSSATLSSNNKRHLLMNKASRSLTDTGRTDFYVTTLDDTQGLLQQPSSSSNNNINHALMPVTPTASSASHRVTISSASSVSAAFMKESLSSKGFALQWGKHYSHCIPLESFNCIKLGKQTPRTKASKANPTHLLSLCVKPHQDPKDQQHKQQQDGTAVLDIEAPSKLDRDLFANAFSCFLSIPILSFEVDWDGADASQEQEDPTKQQQQPGSRIKRNMDKDSSKHAASSTHNRQSKTKATTTIPSSPQHQHQATPIAAAHKTAMTANSSDDDAIPSTPTSQNVNNMNIQRTYSQDPTYSTRQTYSPMKPLGAAPGPNKDKHIKNKEHVIDEEQADDEEDDDDDDVSSLTNHFDMEYIDELHAVISQLKHELQEARNEAGRAVKVAEQAIQSAENVHNSSSKNGSPSDASSSNNHKPSDWNTTVTHQAAKAAALAQKKSAAALSRARLAEEELTQEQQRSRVLQEGLAKVTRQYQMLSGKLMYHKVDGIGQIASSSSNSNNNENVVEEEILWRRQLLEYKLNAEGRGRVFACVKQQEELQPHSIKRESPILLSFRQSTGSNNNDNDDDVVLLTCDGVYNYSSSSNLHRDDSDHEYDNYLNSYQEMIHPLLMDAVIEGYSNVCVSISMHSNTIMALQEEVRGMLYHSVRSVLNHQSNANCDIEDDRGRCCYQLSLSLLEIHNERLYDLLHPPPSSSKSASTSTSSSLVDVNNMATPAVSTHNKLEIKTNSSGDVSLVGLKEVQIFSMNDLVRHIKHDNGNADENNYHGGHIIVSLTIVKYEQQNAVKNISVDKEDIMDMVPIQVGKMSFVQLAVPANTLQHQNCTVNGSNSKHIHKSYQHFNHILKMLSPTVKSSSISSFVHPSSFSPSPNKNNIPYRNATLTHLVKDVLNCGTEAMGTYMIEDYSYMFPYSYPTATFNAIDKEKVEQQQSYGGKSVASSSLSPMKDRLGYLSGSMPHSKLCMIMFVNSIVENENYGVLREMLNMMEVFKLLRVRYNQY